MSASMFPEVTSSVTSLPSCTNDFDNDISDLMRDNFGEMWVPDIKPDFKIETNDPLLDEILDDIPDSKNEKVVEIIDNDPDIKKTTKEIEEEERLSMLRKAKFTTKPAYKRRIQERVESKARQRDEKRGKEIGEEISNKIFEGIKVPLLSSVPNKHILTSGGKPYNNLTKISLPSSSLNMEKKDESSSNNNIQSSLMYKTTNSDQVKQKIPAVNTRISSHPYATDKRMSLSSDVNWSHRIVNNIISSQSFIQKQQSQVGTGYYRLPNTSKTFTNIAPKSSFSNVHTSELGGRRVSSLLPGQIRHIIPATQMFTRNGPVGTGNNNNLNLNMFKQNKSESITSNTQQNNIRIPVITPNFSVVKPRLVQSVPKLDHNSNNHLLLPQNLAKLCSLCRQLVSFNRISGPVRLKPGICKICPECGLYVQQSAY